MDTVTCTWSIQTGFYWVIVNRQLTKVGYLVNNIIIWCWCPILASTHIVQFITEIFVMLSSGNAEKPLKRAHIGRRRSLNLEGAFIFNQEKEKWFLPKMDGTVWIERPIKNKSMPTTLSLSLSLSLSLFLIFSFRTWKFLVTTITINRFCNNDNNVIVT